jgi:transcriptional regulator with XRE-family HTH domain
MNDGDVMALMGRRLAAARHRAGYRTQRDFANALGVSHGAVAGWEREHKRPGRDNLAKIANLCGVSMDYLQGGGEDIIAAMPSRPARKPKNPPSPDGAIGVDDIVRFLLQRMSRDQLKRVIAQATELL